MEGQVVVIGAWRCGVGAKNTDTRKRLCMGAVSGRCIQFVTDYYLWPNQCQC